MNTQTIKPETSDQVLPKKGGWRSVALSVFIHVIALVLLAFFFTTRGGDSSGESIRRVAVVLSSPAADTELFEYESEADVTESSQSQLQALPEEQPPNLPDVSVDDLPGFEMDSQIEFDASRMAVVPQNSNPAEKFELSKEDLKFIAQEQKFVRDRQPKGDPARTSIFGSAPLEGRRFVFVLDRSKSMGESGLGVMERAIGELEKSLGDLGDNHSFQVVAYHQSTVTIGERSLLTANAENKKRVKPFMQGLVAFGSTKHENGLSAGLAFRPDILVFMTDGGLPVLNGGQVEAMTKMAGRKTQIHCLQFGSGPNQQRENFMMELATETGGSYRYINVMDWK